jgi:FlaA1/EpsC-like NDP-sugar epimerase
LKWFQILNIDIESLVLSFPRPVKRLIVVVVDVLTAVLTVWISYYLRIGEFLPLLHSTGEFYPLRALIVSVFLSVPIFMIFGLYQIIFRFSGSAALIAVIKAVSLYGLIFSFIFSLVSIPGVPRTIGIIQPILMFIFVCLSRLSARLWLGGLYRERVAQKQNTGALIYGAGSSGRQLAAAMSHNPEINVLGFLDDDAGLQGNKVSGLPVYDPTDLKEVVKSRNIGEILLALPTIGRRRRNIILQSLAGQGLAVRTVPSYSDLAKGLISVSDVKELSIDDILGRVEIVAAPDLISRDIKDQIVLVTGAGGSIGRELCRQIFYQNPKKMIFFDHSEFALYEIHQEMLSLASNNESAPELKPVLGSVLNKNHVERVIKNNKPTTIFHSAAYKHVPLFESNKFEGVRNNVFGTKIIAESAIKYGVNKFVLISTDKAVRPTNVMGASKRIAEMLLQALSSTQKKTVFAIVRFGNVLDSSGSVVPMFRQQIRAGGPITVTHKEVTRYFMTISEAAQLVIQAGAMTGNWEKVGAKKSKGNIAPVYVLDMGEPVKIYDLACRMISLSGLTVFNSETGDGDIEIKIVGLRPGEKLFEELLIGGSICDSPHPKIKYANEDFLSWLILRAELKSLKKAIEHADDEALSDTLHKLVAGFSPGHNPSCSCGH